MTDIALVYLVAGLSSRFDGKIKQFAEVGPKGETLIEYSLTQALPAGFTKIIFIVGEKTEQPFKEMFGDNYNNLPVQYAFQKFDRNTKKRPWGTLDALCSAKEILDCPFVVCNGDDIYGPNSFKILVNHLKTKLTDATLGYKLEKVLPDKGKVNRGIYQITPDKKVISIKEEIGIEKTNLTQRGISMNALCSMNIFGLQPKTLDSLLEVLKIFKQQHIDDPQIEALLPEEITKLIQQRKMILEIYPATDQWFGVTCPEDEKIVREQLLS